MSPKEKEKSANHASGNLNCLINKHPAHVLDAGNWEVLVKQNNSFLGTECAHMSKTKPKA